MIFNKKGEIFLAKRSGKVKNQSGWWSKPGGTVKYGEKVISCYEKRSKRRTRNRNRYLGIFATCGSDVERRKSALGGFQFYWLI